MPRGVRLQTGGAPAPLKGRTLNFRTQYNAPPKLFAPNLRAPTLDVPNKVYSPFTNMERDTNLIVNAIMKRKNDEDKVNAERALLAARERSRQLFRGVDKQGNVVGYSQQRSQDAIDGFLPYQESVRSIYEEVGSTLSDNARLLFEARARGYRTADIEKGLDHRVYQERIRNKDLIAAKTQSFQADVAGGYYDVLRQFQQGNPLVRADGTILPSKSFFERSLPESGITEIEKDELRVKHYRISIDSILSGPVPEGSKFKTTLDAAIDFDRKFQKHNTPIGRQKLREYFREKLKAQDAEKSRQEQLEINNAAVNFKAGLGKVLAHGIMDQNKLIYDNYVKQYNALVKASEGVGDDRAFTKDVADQIAYGLIEISKDEDIHGGNGLTLIRNSWSEFSKKNNIPVEIKFRVNDKIVKYEEDLLKMNRMDSQRKYKKALKQATSFDEKGRPLLSEQDLRNVIPDPDMAQKAVSAQRAEIKVRKGLISEVEEDERDRNDRLYEVKAREGKLRSGSEDYDTFQELFAQGKISVSGFDRAEKARANYGVLKKTDSPVKKRVLAQVKAAIKDDFLISEEYKEKGGIYWKDDKYTEVTKQLAFQDAITQLERDVNNSKDPKNFNYSQWLTDYITSFEGTGPGEERSILKDAWNFIKKMEATKSVLLNVPIKAIEGLSAEAVNLQDFIPSMPTNEDSRLKGLSPDEVEAAQFLQNKLGAAAYNQLNETSLRKYVQQIINSEEYQKSK
ncbi:MAG: hypothetical protein PVG39_00815 [Desulfobacteraceae bacterium]